MSLTDAMPRILVADDQDDICLSLRLALKREGFEIATARSPEAALSAVAAGAYDVVLMDLNYTRDTTSGGEGLDLLGRLHAVDSELRVIAMTAWGTIDLAVEAMRRGAGDFVLKPWDNAALVRTVRAQVEARRALGPSRDLALARRVQSRLLPQFLPQVPSLECAAACVEAGAVGGDGYDFIDLGERRLAVVLADASGKGVSGALLWTHLQASLRAEPERAFDDIAALLSRLNRRFLASTAPEHYATVFIGVYDDASRRLRYVSCGHNPALLLRAEGALERLGSNAPPLGLLDGWAAETSEVALGPGDVLLLYSDGVTEAQDAQGGELGEGRLQRSLLAHRAGPLSELPGRVLADVRAFADPRPQDDRTVVALRGAS